jgi:uncharacterized protein YkwD
MVGLPARIRLGGLLLALVIVGGDFGGATPPPAAPAAATTSENYRPDAEECAFLRRINTYRKRHGKRPLRLSATLGAAAEHHSLDMAATDHRHHTLSDGTSAAKNIANHGYPTKTWGENIAWGTPWDRAGDPFAWWRKSPSHDHNMLDGDYRAIGVARAYNAGSRYQWYWTTTFGGRAHASVRC